MRKYSVLILRNENDKDFKIWESTCGLYKERINYRVINLTNEDWFEKIHEEPFDYLLVKPSGYSSKFKTLYDERLTILSRELKYPAFPSLEEVLIYENKRYLSYWLKSNKIPHPRTFVSYYKKESLKYIESIEFPIVAKLNIGASGKGVKILHKKLDAIKYINEIFSSGTSSRTGPSLRKGNWIKRAWNKIKDPGAIKERINTYKQISRDKQKGFLLFQEYIKHNFEWRVVRIGDSFFAHKKLVKNEKASGTLLKQYDDPPISLLDFVKEITDRLHFNSQAVDVFQTENDVFLVNEMQCMFGQSDPYQMKVNNVPGRYICNNGNWEFEEGHFNENQSYNLRIEFIIDQLDNKVSK